MVSGMKIIPAGRLLLEKDVIRRCQFFKKIENYDFSDILWIGETCFTMPLRRKGFCKDM